MIKSMYLTNDQIFKIRNTVFPSQLIQNRENGPYILYHNIDPPAADKEGYFKELQLKLKEIGFKIGGDSVVKYCDVISGEIQKLQDTK